VFAEVKAAAGEVQDFGVKTAYGIAKAKGTSFMVTSKDESMVVATITGEVEVSDSHGKFIGTSNPIAPKIPGVVSGQLSKMAAETALAEALASVQTFNTQTAQLLEKQAKDPNSLTEEEKTFLAGTVEMPEALVQELNTAVKQQTTPTPAPTPTVLSNLPINFNPDSHIAPTTPA
jgi:hypothetical protein